MTSFLHIFAYMLKHTIISRHLDFKIPEKVGCLLFPFLSCMLFLRTKISPNLKTTRRANWTHCPCGKISAYFCKTLPVYCTNSSRSSSHLENGILFPRRLKFCNKQRATYKAFSKACCYLLFSAIFSGNPSKDYCP